MNEEQAKKQARALRNGQAAPSKQLPRHAWHGSGSGSSPALPRLHIYGPAGLAQFLRSSFSPTLKMNGGLPLDITELLQPGQTPESGPHLGSYRAVHADADGAYRLVNGKGFTVLAAPIKHSVPCYGYVVECASKRHMDPAALKARGLYGPMIKQLVLNGSIEAPDGSGVVTVEDVSLSGAPGIKIVVLGDNCAAPALVPFAMDADVSHSVGA